MEVNGAGITWIENEFEDKVTIDKYFILLNKGREGARTHVTKVRG